jgi:hypothetical protein
MGSIIPLKIQIISIVGSLLFMFFIFRLIVKGYLREEYSIIWIFSTLVLLLFSIWRNGLDIISASLGVYYPPSLIFLAAIFSIFIFLVHLSIVNSKQHKQIQQLAHEIALLKNTVNEIELNRSNI